MKKLILLFAVAIIGFAANAQNTYCKSGMVVIVTQAKHTFSKGESYKDWLLAQTGNSTVPTAEEDKFLKDVYGFLAAGSNSDAIYKNYDGTSLNDLAKLQKDKGLTVLGASNERCGFWCQLLVEIIKIIIDYIPGMP